MTFDLHVFPDMDAVAAEAARRFADAAQTALRAHGKFSVVLSGGSTPQPLFELLGAAPAYANKVPWKKTHFFFADERHVPPDHPESNYGQAYRLLLSRRPIPPANIVRFKGEAASAQEAAQAYSTALREFFTLKAYQSPPFDLILLGLGSDGHTASLFPDVPVPTRSGALAAALWIPHLQAYRMTLTPLALSGARQVIFLVKGREKAAMLKSVLQEEPGRFPAQGVHSRDGITTWLADADAASRLNVQRSRRHR